MPYNQFPPNQTGMTQPYASQTPVQYGQYAYQNQRSMPVQQTQMMPQQPMDDLGFIEVSGIEGVNRYPVAPGAKVQLKDLSSDLLFIKSCDMTGTPLPLRVFRLTDITAEYQQNEGPVTRKEFSALQDSIAKLGQMLEDLTAPSVGGGVNG